MCLTCNTDQAQTPPILVNTACLYPDNTHTHTQPGVNFLLCKVCESPSLKTVIELRWVLLQKLRKCQYDYSNLSISISLWSSAVRVKTVILLHRRCVMKTATRKLWFSFISEWSSIGVVYSGCSRRITSLRGRAAFSGKPSVWGKLSESRRRRQTQLKIGLSEWMKLSYSEAGH